MNVMEEKLKIEKLDEAITQMSKGKSPGPDVLHLQQTLLSRATYSKYRDIHPKASRVKCLAQKHNIILHGRESIRQSSDF